VDEPAIGPTIWTAIWGWLKLIKVKWRHWKTGRLPDNSDVQEIGNRAAGNLAWKASQLAAEKSSLPLTVCRLICIEKILVGLDYRVAWERHIVTQDLVDPLTIVRQRQPKPEQGDMFPLAHWPLDSALLRSRCIHDAFVDGLPILTPFAPLDISKTFTGQLKPVNITDARASEADNGIR
jgi:hypothetical protein